MSTLTPISELIAEAQEPFDLRLPRVRGISASTVSMRPRTLTKRTKLKRTPAMRVDERTDESRSRPSFSKAQERRLTGDPHRPAGRVGAHPITGAPVAREGLSTAGAHDHPQEGVVASEETIHAIRAQIRRAERNLGRAQREGSEERCKLWLSRLESAKRRMVRALEPLEY